jgi:hypothetical protein
MITTQAGKVLKSISGIIAVLCLLLCAIFGILFWIQDPYNFRAPKDQQLVDIFYSHQDTFEKIRLIMIKNSLDDMKYGNIITHKPINENLKLEIKSLISGINPSVHIMKQYQTNEVYFIFVSGGILSIGEEWQKGIVYLPEDFLPKEMEILKNLDNAHSLARSMYYLRTIKPHWFVFYHSTD